jgi:hypothetical protein
MKFHIDSNNAYQEIIMAIYELMNKGEDKLTALELEKLAAMVAAAERYEDEVCGVKP